MKTFTLYVKKNTPRVSEVFFKIDGKFYRTGVFQVVCKKVISKILDKDKIDFLKKVAERHKHHPLRYHSSDETLFQYTGQKVVVK